MTDLLIEAAKVMLVRNEGIRLKPYRDTTGRLTIGIGRNLDDVGITRKEALLLLDSDLVVAINGANQIFGDAFSAMAEARKLAIIDLVFNLGKGGFLSFHNTVKAIVRGEWKAAADNLLMSKYAKQVGARANRNAFMLEFGVMPSETIIT